MARYAFSYTVDGVCKLHAESSFEEEMLDVDEDGNLHIEMTGNGYLAFWLRCKKMIRDYQRIARAYEHNTLVRDTSREDFKVGTKCMAIITDLDSGIEKEI